MVKKQELTPNEIVDYRDFKLLLHKQINALHLMQIWRRGGKTPMPLSPEAYGVVLDNAIRIFRTLRNNLP